MLDVGPQVGAPPVRARLGRAPGQAVGDEAPAALAVPRDELDEQEVFLCGGEGVAEEGVSEWRVARIERSSIAMGGS